MRQTRGVLGKPKSRLRNWCRRYAANSRVNHSSGYNIEIFHYFRRVSLVLWPLYGFWTPVIEVS